MKQRLRDTLATAKQLPTMLGHERAAALWGRLLKLRSSSLAVVIAETCLVLVVAVIAARLIGIHLAPAETAAPSIVRESPDPQAVGVPLGAEVSALFSESLARRTVNGDRFTLQPDNGQPVAARIGYDPATFRATLQPLSPLRPGTTYRVTVRGGSGGVTDRRDRPLGTTQSWTFTTGVTRRFAPTEGPGGPILVVTSSVVTSSQNGFSQYYPEILRAEGLNEFSVCDVTELSRTLLDRHAVVLLGDLPLSARQSGLIDDFVRRGGGLIAMRPDVQLARRLGVTASSGQQLKDAYISIDAQSRYGAGLVHEPIQFHGPADLYSIRNGTVVATFYENASKASPYSAVATVQHGRGTAVVFAYDLARSVIYTRQGNPAWSGEERDGRPPIRSDDLFYGKAANDPQPDWVNPQKIAIPQADEQQHLLANLILMLTAGRMPLPRFWYLPRGVKAAIIMTGDDHNSGGTFGRFQSYLAKSPPHCAPQDWECVHATAYIFDGSLSAARATTLTDEGFEIALHLSTDCKDWASGSGAEAGSHAMRSAVDAIYTRQLAAFAATYPALSPPATVRTHCIVWGDYDTQPQVEARHGIRLDTNYYYWPPEWVRNRPGLFTGSGMPMRFATIQGAPIDVYQAPTQMTDESQQTYPYTVDTLLANALGPHEYYGVFTANLHNDRRYSAAANSVVAAALAHHVPMVSAAEMLHWLDGRNNSSFRALQWSDGKLSFNIDVAIGGDGIQAFLPMGIDAGRLTSLTLNGVEVKRESRRFAGLTYAAFSAGAGRFIATYTPTDQRPSSANASR